MTVNEGIELLYQLEKKCKKGIITDSRIIVGVARVGSEGCLVKCDAIKNLKGYNFGKPPHSIIIPAQLHPKEKEYLEIFAKAPKNL